MSTLRQRQRNIRAKADHVIDCVCSSLPTLHQTSGDTHSFCVLPRPIVFLLLVQGMSLFVLPRTRVGVRVVLPGRRRICRPSFSLDSFRLKRPDANGPWPLRAGRSGEEQCTPHYMVPISPQCPQEISLLNLTVFQGAEVSSEHFSFYRPET